MIDFCILGSGVSGSTIANLLSKKYLVEVFDKAKGPGGRTSNKRFNSKLSFDHGTQYISPKSDEFKKFINNLYKKKILKIWSGNHLDFTFKSNNETSKFVGAKANNAICKYQLKKIKQNYLSHIDKITHKNKSWEITFKNKKKIYSKAIILTCPYPQLKKIAKNYLNKKLLNLDIKMQPNLTVMLALKNQNISNISSIKFNDDVIAWAANENSKKRFKSNTNLWTLQSSLNWSKKNINLYKKNKKIVNLLVSKFLKLTNMDKDKIIYKNIHGWKYSFNYNKSKIKSYWDNNLSFGICGDWFLGPKCEDAWRSAVDLSKKIKKNPLISKRV